jgi:hypothetical protein
LLLVCAAVSSKASAISLIAYLPSSGLVIPASKLFPALKSIFLKSGPKFLNASASLS